MHHPKEQAWHGYRTEPVPYSRLQPPVTRQTRYFQTDHDSRLASAHGRNQIPESRSRFGDGGGRMRRIGIVAMARRLVIDLWRYVEFGVVPEGARLKVA